MEFVSESHLCEKIMRYERLEEEEEAMEETKIVASVLDILRCTFVCIGT